MSHGCGQEPIQRALRFKEKNQNGKEVRQRTMREFKK